MTSPELPAEFMCQEVGIKGTDGEEQRGRITQAVLPFYIVFRVECSKSLHLIPWGAVSDIWVPDKKVEAQKK